MIDWDQRNLEPRDGDGLSNLYDLKLHRRPFVICERNLFEVRPYLIVKDKLPERRHDFIAAVNVYGRVEGGESFGHINRQRRCVIAVSMRHHYVADHAYLVGRESKSEAAAVNRQP